MRAVAIEPCPAVVGKILPPGSKSITNRAVVCASLANGRSRLSGVLRSEDTEVMVQAWQSLGLSIEWDTTIHEMQIAGCNGQVRKTDHILNLANSGTSIRFLTAALAAIPTGRIVLDGVPRMRERPIGDLLSALDGLGATCRSLNTENNDCPPVEIGPLPMRGGRTNVLGNISSQYLSGLLMAAPMAKQTCEIIVQGSLVSVPYVTMTCRVMESFGVHVEEIANGYRIEPQPYIACDYAIEPDASAASYFWAAAAITGGNVHVAGLNPCSLQGDVQFTKILNQMGCEVHAEQNGIRVIGGPLRGVDVDMSDISDTVQTLAAVAVFAEGATRIRGVAHNRHKETDRIGDLARELRKLGAEVEEFDDGLEITPKNMTGATIETYNDHRMAMSLSLIGLRLPEVWIKNPECTAKTYPDFFADLQTYFGVRCRYKDLHDADLLG